VYSSDPGMSRLVTLKSEHKQLKSSYNNLIQLYRRLKQGGASEVSAIIEQIKFSDKILNMSEHKGRLLRSGDCV
jgi:hemerythrin-like domain-containing protein